MAAFVPSASFQGVRASAHVFPATHAHPTCKLPTSTLTTPNTPFFKSTAFGSPMPARLHHPTSQASNGNVHSRKTPSMEVSIVVGDNEPVESALRRFKKDVAKSGHLFELKRRRYFETNTEKRIRKAAAARRKAKMARNAKPISRQGGAQKK